MKIRRIKLLIANGWFKVVCLVSYSLFSMFCSSASAQEQKETPVVNIDGLSMVIGNSYIMERNQGYHARAYGPRYPEEQYPLLVLDGNVIDPFSVDMQYLDSIVEEKVCLDATSVARLFGIKKRQIKSYGVLRTNAAIAVWGQRGKYGALEVTTNKWYRKQKKAGKLNRL